jgi:hypothetical protein
MFFDCLSSKNVWTMRNFSNSVTAGQCKNIDESLMFKLSLQLNGDDATLMTSVVWSIWKQRNNLIWNNVTYAPNFVFSRV